MGQETQLADISPAQIRAARGLVDWSIEDLAANAGISREALSKIERGHSRPQRGTIDLLASAFIQRGVVFTEDDGVRLRNDMFRVIEGDDAYLRLLDDVFVTLRGTGSEILFFYIDNAKSPQAVIDSDLRLRHDGIRFRSLIDEDKPYCLYPLKEYRCVPHMHFHNNPIVVYGDKVGVFIDASSAVGPARVACHLTHHASYANAMRRIFEALWSVYKMPRKNLAEVTYE
jgi:transcriptional regulator with XRE-family HTH domain